MFFGSGRGQTSPEKSVKHAAKEAEKLKNKIKRNSRESNSKKKKKEGELEEKPKNRNETQRWTSGCPGVNAHFLGFFK